MATFFAKRPSIPVYWECTSNDYDDRESDGFYQFNRDQFYEGHFLGDSLHGQGTYNWLNLAVYDGGFYSNCKEGYASLSFPDSSYFEGLFVENKPFGPGILTHPNGRQDAGFWKGNKLVRLSRTVDFIIPRLAPTSAAKIKLLQFRRLIPLDEDNLFADDSLEKYGHPFGNFSTPYSSLIYDRRSTFFDKQAFEKAYFSSPRQPSSEMPMSPLLSPRFSAELESEEAVENREIPPHCVCSSEVFVMRYETVASVDVCDDITSSEEEEMGILAYFAKYGTDTGFGNDMSERESDLEVMPSEGPGDAMESKDKSKAPKIVSWNRNELCTEMLKQIFRFRDFEGKLNFSLSKLMVGARTAFRKTGENEMQCLHFLKMCSLGPAHVVKSILCSQNISEELMDARGNNSLMFAAATDQHDVIEVLVNYGVSVNSFNDEGLTPLNLCLLRRLAQANGISSWETAFLPKEIDETQEVDSQMEGYSFKGSIASLDRIFGDGMSLNESLLYTTESHTDVPVVTSPKPVVAVESRPMPRVKVEGSKAMIPSASKIRGSLSIINWEWEFRSRRSSSIIALSNATPTLNIKIIPKSVRRDEFQKSIRKTSKDKYLFELYVAREQSAAKPEESSSSVKRKPNKKDEKQSEVGGEDDNEEEEDDMEDVLTSGLGVTERIAEIDKTIAILLKKGADPNISEVPKPSIHLGLFTRDFKTVYNLLSHGADPDIPLHSNESRLTPLHVLALQEPASEFVDICDLLLHFKANPDIETLPGFSISKEEEQYLDPEHGRTPLQLICMRPDVEFADPHGNLIRIALMLAKFCQTKRQYNGHSYLTLAMICGNVKLLEALLGTGLFDPKDILGKNRGTCLHVLVSNDLQRKTSLNTSLKMCDLLIEAGADPFKWFRTPKSLHGTCVDYGYREIDELKETQKEEIGDVKKLLKFQRERVSEKDPHKDQLRLVEYLSNFASHWTRRKTGSRPRSNLAPKRSGSDRFTIRRNTRLVFSPSRKTKGTTGTSQETVASRGKWKEESARPGSAKGKKKSQSRNYYGISRREMMLAFHGSQTALSHRKKEHKRKSTADTAKQKRNLSRSSEEKSDFPSLKSKGKSKQKEKSRRAFSVSEDGPASGPRGTKRKSKLPSGTTKRNGKPTSPDSEDDSEFPSRDAKRKSKPGLEKRKQKHKVTSLVSGESSEPPSRDSESKLPSETVKRNGKPTSPASEEESESPSPHAKRKSKLAPGKTKQKRRPASPASDEDSESPTRDAKRKSRLGPEKTKQKHRPASPASEEDSESSARDAKRKGKLGPEKTKQKRKVISSASEEDVELPSPDTKRKRKRGSESIREASVLDSRKTKGKPTFLDNQETKEKNEAPKKRKERHRDVFLKKAKRSREITFVDSASEGFPRRKTFKKESVISDVFRTVSGEGTSAGKRMEGRKKKVTEKAKPPNVIKTGPKPSVKSLHDKQTSSPEVFPEKLRQIFLRLYGNCVNMDINEFLMPYVVLRDGELYYKFKGKATKQKEQYSLV